MCSVFESIRNTNRGVNEGIIAHAKKLSEDLDAFVLVPDLYRGKVGVDKEEASHLMGELDFMQAAKEIGECASYMKEKMVGAEKKKVGTIGFCMGGALSILGGSLAEDVDAIVCFYGIPSGFDVEKNCKKPVLGMFGEKDNLVGFSSKDDALQLNEKLKNSEAREDSDVLFFEGVGHAFMNQSPNPYESFEEREKSQGFPAYDETQASKAWEKTNQFFTKYL